MFFIRKEVSMPKLKKEYADLRKKEIIKAAWKSFMERDTQKPLWEK